LSAAARLPAAEKNSAALIYLIQRGHQKIILFPENLFTIILAIVGFDIPAHEEAVITLMLRSLRRRSRSSARPHESLIAKMILYATECIYVNGWRGKCEGSAI